MDDKTIVVSGASSGLGYQISKELLAIGSRIIMIGRDEKKLTKSKNELIKNTLNDKIITYQADISNKIDIKNFSKFLIGKKIFIYGLVNNAGINPSRENILRTKNKDWEKTIHTNIFGTYYLTKVVIKNMLQNKFGSIVNISSIAGIIGMKKRFSYMVAKSSMIGFTKSIAMDYSNDNIRSNCICPGYVETPLTKNYLSSLGDESLEKLNKQHLLKGIGESKDISGLVVFLLSEKADWITGSIIPVDGGFTLGINL